jgi:uncharacterized OsmC-like protein/predicted CoA-binding protein
LQKEGSVVVSLDHRNPEASSLRFFFSPASVAVIGATEREGSVGGTVIRNLSRGAYRGRVYPVNLHRSEICGFRCYHAIAAVPEAVDLVVIVTPAGTVPGVVGECEQLRRSGTRPKARQHKIVCDQPPENGGFDEAMAPPELLLASLGSCAGFYAVLYLKKHKLAAEGTRIRVTADKLKEPARMDDFHIEVEVPSHLERTTPQRY